MSNETLQSRRRFLGQVTLSVGGMAVSGFAQASLLETCLAPAFAPCYADPCGDWQARRHVRGLSAVCIPHGRRGAPQPSRDRRCGCRLALAGMTRPTAVRWIIACSLAILGAVAFSAYAAAAESDSTARRAWRSSRPMSRPPKTCSAIKRLQRTYGYFLDKGMWTDLAEYFTDDAEANYPAGVYIGKESIRDASVSQCRQRADGAGGPRGQSSLQPHEHPAGGASGSGWPDRRAGGGVRWPCSAASAAARPGQRAFT